ncbi:NUDIX domain-containing protein [Stenotrophomonas maltophilia]|uniref:NUDIX hydrolase n=1 Tax=Stenotrophomonas TaxID=40323 RepID=UPI0006C6E621|nr:MULTISPECIES: NUDIX domain-containing protein [Stenotrophomonas]KAA3603139.1 NUDIX domain-containing protein [Stenotrophomonas maltophilia]KOO80682.1 NTP pyrophosphohydrolase [Stenotrophomonas maltophilia]KRG80215.1 NTP pyrophosphohydrolase [Stenotrophomonas pavanii]MBN5126902.1 NUDIX domain-containing protein [Stenotrophomonas maltophilia]MBN7836901.1 NUDIX domain-containing protein [Stenotrophomonas maltophilia]
MEIRRSARLVIVAEDAVLLFRYHDEHHAPFWATPGGELLPGEGYVDAARRELREETGLDLPIGVRLEKRDAVYAVARSTPARWLEEYFLVRSPNQPDIQRDGWTEEENATIRAWKWWRVEEMREQPASLFKPEWLPDLFERVPA